MIKACECGAKITAEDKYKKLAGGGVAHYTYYHCTKKKNPDCSQPAIEEKELEKQIAVELAALQIPAEFKSWALSRLKEMNAKEIADREQMTSNQRHEYDACVRKIDNLIDMRANGELDEQEFRSRKENLLVEKDRLWAYLKDTDKRVENWLEIAERGFNFAEKSAVVFARAQRESNSAVKKEIFSALGSDYTLKDKKLNVCLDNLLFPIRNGADEIRRITSRLEPKKKLAVARDMGKIYAKNPRLLPDLDSNQGDDFQRVASYH